VVEAWLIKESFGRVRYRSTVCIDEIVEVECGMVHLMK